MNDLFKQLEKEVKREAKKIEKSFNKDFNRWINQFADRHVIDPEKLEVNQKNPKRFAEIFHNGEKVAYVTLDNNQLKFHELI